MKYLKLIAVTMSLIGLLSMGAVSADSVRSLEPSNVDLFATNSFQSDACNGLSAISNTGGCGSTSNTLGDIIKTVVGILSIVVGALSVIMIIVAGIRFTTSSGDSNGVAGARKTLIYALVGLAVAILAQLLIHFAFNTASTIVTTPPSSSFIEININGLDG